MLSTLVLTMCLVGAPEGGNKDLKAVVASLEKAGSYTFEATTKSEGGSGGRDGGSGGRDGGSGGRDGDSGRGPGGPGGPSETTVVGRVSGTGPVQLTSGDVEVWKQGEDVVARVGDGGFEKVERPDMRGGRRGGGYGGGGGQGEGGREGEGDKGEGGGRGGDEGGQGEGGREGEGRRGDASAMRARMQAYSVSQNHTPAQILAAVLPAAGQLKCEERDGSVVWSGPLPKDVAASLSGSSRFARGGQGPEASGEITITAMPDGSLQSIALTTTTKFGSGERSFERKQTSNVKVHDIGTTKLEVPEEVKTKLTK